MSNPLSQIKTLLQRKDTVVARVTSGSGVTATVSGSGVHPNAMPGDTLLTYKGRVLRLPRPPNPTVL